MPIPEPPIDPPDLYEDDVPCMCGHRFDEHDGYSGPCDVEDCDCAAYEADEEYGRG